jgi:hypothetical protein
MAWPSSCATPLGPYCDESEGAEERRGSTVREFRNHVKGTCSDVAMAACKSVASSCLRTVAKLGLTGTTVSRHGQIVTFEKRMAWLMQHVREAIPGSEDDTGLVKRRARPPAALKGSARGNPAS